MGRRMEELVFFLGQHGLNASLHTVFENERIEVPSFIFGKAKFGVLLESNDPPHWMTNDAGIDIATSLQKYPVADDVAIVYPFTYTVSEVGEKHDNQTDRAGWRYSSSFQGKQWEPLPFRGCKVRQRRWERLTVLKHQYHQCMCVVPEYYKQLTEFRCLHPAILRASIGLKNIPYKVQFVMENQRRRNGVFSSAHLDPEDDPPQWSVAPPSDMLNNPSLCDATNVEAYDIEEHYFDRTEGFDLLHNFIYVLYPGKDCFGWEYSSDFYCGGNDTWIASYPDRDVSILPPSDEIEERCVRRRLWFRTIVADCDVIRSRSILRNYLSERPSGVTSDGTLLLLNSFGNKWREVVATLSGSRLLVHDPQKNMKEIFCCDMHNYVMSVLQAKDCPGKNRGFGLRLRSQENIHSFKAIFCAQNLNDHIFWTEKIEYQICQIDLCRRLFYGPPLLDTVIIVNDMWMRRKSRIPHNWGLKTFELHNNGYLRIYNGTHLKCIYDIIKCQYAHKIPSVNDDDLSCPTSETFCGDGSRFEFSLLLRDREKISIRAMSKTVMKNWMESLALFNGEENTEFVIDHFPGHSETQVFPEKDNDERESFI